MLRILRHLVTYTLTGAWHSAHSAGKIIGNLLSA